MERGKYSFKPFGKRQEPMKSLESIAAAKRTILSVARNTLGHARPFFLPFACESLAAEGWMSQSSTFCGSFKTDPLRLANTSSPFPDAQKIMLQCGFEMGLCPTVTTHYS